MSLEAEILPPQTADQTRTTLSWEILLENHQQIDACALGCEISTLRRASLGAVIILLTWFYITGLMLLVGAEINSEIEAAAAEKRLAGPTLGGGSSLLG